MLLINLILFLCMGARPTQADPHDVSLALEVIRVSAQRLSMAVIKWDGVIFTAFPILIKSTGVQKATKAATYATIQSDPFDLFEALEVGTVAKYLVQDVESLLHYMGQTQPKFKKAILNSFVYGQIKMQEKVCEDLFYEVVKKLPNMAKGEGEKLQRRVALAFSVVKRKFKPDDGALDSGDEELWKTYDSEFLNSIDDADFWESVENGGLEAAPEVSTVDSGLSSSTEVPQQ